ncbi:MAG TPA: hypothetical protein VIW22_00695, partial [Nitrososphaerales archaeon]
RGGVMTLQSMKYLPCSCRVCSKTNVRGLLELDQKERVKLLSVHNLFTLKAELDACKEAIVEGRLWDLVEERSMAHPRLREAFVELSRLSNFLSAGTPAMKDKGLFVRSTEDLQRPEVRGAAAKLERAVKRSSKRAAIMIRDESRARDGGTKTPKPPGALDTYILHPVFGPYPSELEFVYPFSQTEVGAAEHPISLDAAKKTLRRWGYKTVQDAGPSKKELVKVRSRRSRRAASPSPR